MDVHFSTRCAGRSVRLTVFGIFFVIMIARSVTSYNLEDRLPLFKYGPSGSHFGFSVAQHRTSSDDTLGVVSTLLVVGAPTAIALGSQQEPKPPVNPGGVFYCPVSTDPLDCERIEMDAGGDTVDGDIYTIKSNQWLGVSLKSQGPGKFLVSCAHRFTKHILAGVNRKEIERVCGKCFLLNATKSNIVEEVQPDSRLLDHEFVSSPCDLMKSEPFKLNSKRRYGYAQAGSSISLHNDQYLLGAPGTWAWTGAMFDMDMPNSENEGISSMVQTPTCYRNERSSGIKCDNIPLRRDSYMGFSVATSNAVGTDSDEIFYAAGAPRGNNTGAVVFFKKILADSGDIKNLVHDNVNTVVGQAKGIASSFGYSIALTDINGDDLDDLIVGAPQFYEYNNQHKRGGAVYIYKNHPDRGFSQIFPQVFYGPLDSFFGHSVAALGDIDQDGYNDFAVGSPYENENGTVHIFRGSLDGKVKKSQTIIASDYSFIKEDGKGEVVGFGAALSGNIDADGNKYPDLLIGTLSDHIALLRSRPIISAIMTLDVTIDEIDLEIRDCDAGGRRHSCFKLSYCFNYTARHNEYPEDVPIKYKLTLDSIRKRKKKSSRVHLDSPDGPSTIERKFVLPRAGKNVCPGEIHNVYFNKRVEDKLSDIGIKIEFDLDMDEVRREEVGEEVFKMINDPILDIALDKEIKKIVRIKTSCKTDECESNLIILATMPEEVIVGDDAILPVKISVSNDGEEAHQAFITISLPPKIDFSDFEIREPASDDILCYAASSGEASFIRCDLGNPYKPKSKDDITIKLGVSRLTPQDKDIQLQIKGHTTSKNPKIPSVALQSQVVIELDISLTVFAQPEQVRYKEVSILGETGMNTTTDIGPVLVYTFNAKNEGGTHASGVALNVGLPIEINNGKWLLYLVSADVSDGGAVAGLCSSSYINELQLEPSIEAAASSQRQKRETKSPQRSLEPEAEASRSGGGYVSKITLACDKKNTRCVNIKCILDSIAPRATTSVTLQIHVWEPTFLEEFKHIDLVYIRTSVNISSSEENIRFKGDKTSGRVQTTVDHDVFKSDISNAFPWWYILIGVIILLIVYVVIIFFLIRCGFFKRKKFPRHEHEDEKVLVEEKKDHESRM